MPLVLVFSLACLLNVAEGEMCVQWFSSHPLTSFSPGYSEEYNVLSEFYRATNGSNWFVNTGWLEGEPCEDNDRARGSSSWFGVQCEGSSVFTMYV